MDNFAGIVEKNMFAYYAWVGLLIFIAYILASIILGFALGKIIGRKFTVAWIIVVMGTLFYLFDLKYIPLFVILLFLVVLFAYIFKKLKKQSYESS